MILEVESERKLASLLPRGIDHCHEKNDGYTQHGPSRDLTVSPHRVRQQHRGAMSHAPAYLTSKDGTTIGNINHLTPPATEKPKLLSPFNTSED